MKTPERQKSMPMQRQTMQSIVIAIALLAAAPSSAAPSRVTFNQDQVLLIDGRKLFPIGFTMPPPPDGLAPNGKPAYQELREGGGTFIRTGPNRSPGWDDDAFAME